MGQKRAHAAVLSRETYKKGYLTGGIHGSFLLRMTFLASPTMAPYIIVLFEPPSCDVGNPGWAEGP